MKSKQAEITQTKLNFVRHLWKIVRTKFYFSDIIFWWLKFKTTHKSLYFRSILAPVNSFLALFFCLTIYYHHNWYSSRTNKKNASTILNFLSPRTGSIQKKIMHHSKEKSFFVPDCHAPRQIKPKQNFFSSSNIVSSRPMRGHLKNFLVH